MTRNPAEFYCFSGVYEICVVFNNFLNHIQFDFAGGGEDVGTVQCSLTSADGWGPGPTHPSRNEKSGVILSSRYFSCLLCSYFSESIAS